MSIGIAETNKFEDDLEEVELVGIDLDGITDEELSKQLLEQMKTVGFCVFRNVPGFDEPKLLEATKAFHDFPIEVKMKLALAHYQPGNKNLYQGYFPFLENDPSHKEFLDMNRPYEDFSEWEKSGCSLYEERPWITDADIREECEKHLENSLESYQWIHDTFKDQFKVLHDLSLRLVSALAVGLDKPVNYFDDWFRQECSSNIRLLHYLPRDPTKEYKSRLVAPEHSDSGFITLLTTFGFPGLQVEIDGSYRSIKPSKDVVIMNIGETLQRLSNLRIKATRHRVLDIGRERYSAPFFFANK